MAFNGSEGKQITLAEGAALTAEYRRLNPSSTKGHYHGKNVINAILAQPGCMGIRAYYGVDAATGKKELVLVGVDANENDMTNLVADRGLPCPAYCGSSNSLNS